MGTNKNGVIITVYVESSSLTTYAKNNPHQIKKKNKPKKVKSLPKPFLRQGQDRRSQLLAYARSLRNANELIGSYDSQRWSNNYKSSFKSKKWRWSYSNGRVPMRFHGLCYLLKKPRKCHHNSKGFHEQSEVDNLLGKERLIKSRKRKTRYSTFWRRLKNICLGLACGWQCSRGAAQQMM